MSVYIKQAKTVDAISDSLKSLIQLCTKHPMKLVGDPVECNTIIYEGNPNNFYLKLGNIVIFNVEIHLSRNFKDNSKYVGVPCLPYTSAGHFSFTVGYQNVVFKDTTVYSSSSASVYKDSQTLNFLGFALDRSWTLTGDSIYSTDLANSVILVSGVYVTAE